MLLHYYKSPNKDFTLLHGNCLELLPQLDFQFDMIFADPPYFLSNGGISCQAGKVVCVDKGDWDKLSGLGSVDEFNLKWISLCRDKLRDDGTIWITGTYHNIFSVHRALEAQKFKILNVITWVKTNPPPNISCRYFTHSTEFIIWARKHAKRPHHFNYELMKKINGGKQMSDVWRLPAIAPWEKVHGKHPTQKPISLVSRCILASTKHGGWVLDPFCGSGTSGIASSLLGRKFLGIDIEEYYLSMAQKRREELLNRIVRNKMKSKIGDMRFVDNLL